MRCDAMSVQLLPQGLIKQISSAQVISSVSSAVKELLENALDAGATVVDIKLERNGLDKIEIRDNGAGISITDINYVCLPHCTSKIRNFDDLEHLQSYGFRGEALHSLCAVSQLSITTKTVHDKVASTYIFDNNGTVRDVKPSHQMNGTVIVATNLFKNIPVRRQFYESTRKAAEELKKIEKIVKQLSIIHTKLRLTLAHNKCLIWHKTSVCSLRQSLLQVYPSAVLKNLKDVHSTSENVSIEMFIANRDCNLPVLLQPISEAVLLYINQRPVKDKKIEKVIFEEMNHLYASTLPVNKCPLTLLSLRLSPESLDVNLEPNKTKIFIKNHEEMLMKVRETIMRHFYEQPATDDLKSLLLDEDELQNSSKKLKLSVEHDSSVTGELEVSEMRNIIFEKTNVAGETAAQELAGIDLSVFDEPVTSLFTSSDKIRDDTSDLKKYHSCASSNKGVTNSTLKVLEVSEMGNIEKTNVSGETAAQELAGVDLSVFDEPVTSLFTSENGIHDDTSDLKKYHSHASSNKGVSCSTPKIENLDQSSDENSDSKKSKFATTYSKCEKINVGTSYFANENSSKTSYAPESVNKFEDVLNLKNNDAEQLRSSCDTFLSDLLKESSEEKNSSNLTTEDVTPSQWSKGQVTLTDERLKGGVMLFNNSSNTDRRKTTKKEVEKKTDSECKNLDRSVSSQIGRKDMAGFTNFARQIRSEIMKENPGVSFTHVARELANRWSKLHNDDKTSYAENSIRMKRKANFDCKPKETFKKKTLALTVSMNTIVENLKIPGRLCRRVNENFITLIGALETERKWLYKINDDVNVVDVNHLQENVLLHRYICNSSVAVKRLDEPIEISPQMIDENLWNFVLTLDRACDTTDESLSVISDRRITNNGFKVIIRQEHANSYKLSITEVAKEMDGNPIANFVETLKQAVQFEELENCRSQMVKKILLDTVVQVCEQKTIPKETAEIRMLLQYWMQCMLQKKICSHDEPISINLHRL